MSTLIQTERPDAVARTGWWDAPFAVFQTNLREIDVTLDVESTLDDIQEHGADVWLLNVGGILAHYPTDLPFQTRNPHLAERPGGDLIADALAATRRRGMRLLARMDFSKVHPRIVEEHPDWAYRSPTGELQVYEGLVSVCPRGAYYQHRLLDIVDEVLDRYDVDGFFFNWFGFNEVDYGGVVHGVCHCDACRRAWADAQGDRPLPARVGDDGYADWKRLAAAAIDQLTTRIAAHIGARRPDAALILGRAADVLFHEANNAIGRELWPWATGDSVSALRAAQPDKPVMVNAVAFVDMPYRLAGEQPEMMAQYLLQAIARGANPSTYIMGPTRGIRYPSVDAAAEVTRLHRDHRDVYTGLRPAADVAVVIPDPLAAPPERAAQARREYQGVCAALREAHVPFESVAQERLPTVDPARFTAVVLPDLTGVDDAWVERYVTSGGRIVATGTSGIAADGTAAWHPARRVMGAVSDPNALKSSYVQRGPSAPVEGSDVLPLHGTAYELEWRDQTTQDLPVIAQAAYGPPEKAYGHRQGSGRARGAWRRGSGEAVALSWTPGRSYAELGLTAIRDVIADTVRAVGGAQAVEFSGPEAIEVIVGRSDAGLVVHLLNGSGQRRNSFGPVIRTGEVSLRVVGHAGHHARAIVQPDAVRTEVQGDDLLVFLSGVGGVEAIVIGARMPTDTVLVRSDDAAADARRWAAEFPEVRFVTDEEAAAEVTVVAGRVRDEELDDLNRLSWVHSWAAGVEGDLGPRMRAHVRDGQTEVTSSAGNGAAPLAEHAMMLALMLDRDAPRWAQAQRARRWERRTHGELLGRTLGVYGYGNVGRELAARAAAFGMRVIALRRRTGTEDPNVAQFYRPDEIIDFAARCDVLVVAAPLTTGTRGAIGERELSALPAGASVIVISRGGIIDDDALLRALRDGRIKAGLDAHAHEPLPADSPYWGEPTVIVTPHNGATTLATARRGREIFVENLRRRTSGKPMVNLVDVTALG